MLKLAGQHWKPHEQFSFERWKKWVASMSFLRSTNLGNSSGCRYPIVWIFEWTDLRPVAETSNDLWKIHIARRSVAFFWTEEREKEQRYDRLRGQFNVLTACSALSLGALEWHCVRSLRCTTESYNLPASFSTYPGLCKTKDECIQHYVTTLSIDSPWCPMKRRQYYCLIHESTWH